MGCNVKNDDDVVCKQDQRRSVDMGSSVAGSLAESQGFSATVQLSGRVMQPTPVDYPAIFAD